MRSPLRPRTATARSRHGRAAADDLSRVVGGEFARRDRRRDLGNDVNLRDLEGRSALRWQSKDNNASTAIGPFIRLFDKSFALDDVRRAQVRLTVKGEDGFVLDGSSDLGKISRDPADLWRRRSVRTINIPTARCCSRHDVRAGEGPRRARMGFTHHLGDVVTIAADKLGALTNVVTTCDKARPGVSARRI